MAGFDRVIRYMLQVPPKHLRQVNGEHRLLYFTQKNVNSVFSAFRFARTAQSLLRIVRERILITTTARDAVYVQKYVPLKLFL
jgi:hypothetical protein